MGTLSMNGDSTTAPEWFCNATGSPSWSGLKEADIDNTFEQMIIEFCIEEGYRQGWNDSNNNRTSIDCGNIFHPKFLDGKPFSTWREAYLNGIREYKCSIKTST